MVHPMPVKQQRGAGLHMEEWDPVTASRPGSYDAKGSDPNDEYVWGGIMHAINMHVAKFHATALLALLKTKIEGT